MQTKFSEDVIPLTDLKINPGRVVNQVKETHRPVLLTSRGRGIAVVQGLEEYEKESRRTGFRKSGCPRADGYKAGQHNEHSRSKKTLGHQINEN
jgi:prevent-host-death family protein